MSVKDNDPNARTVVYGSGRKDGSSSGRGQGIVLPHGASFPQRYEDESHLEPNRNAGNSPYDQATVPISKPSLQVKHENKTTIVRNAKNPATSTPEDPMNDPVAGWLAIIEGPGRGNICTIGYGFNVIGREKPARIILNYGDSGISRESHAAIIYEKNKRAFFLAHTAGTNLTYKNGELVIAQEELKAGDVVSLGSATALRFIPLCDAMFDWESTNYGQE